MRCVVCIGRLCHVGMIFSFLTAKRDENEYMVWCGVLSVRDGFALPNGAYASRFCARGHGASSMWHTAAHS